MCGIFALLNSNVCPEMNMEMIQKAFKRGENRGPEFSKLVSSKDNKLILGFHRLAINGLNEASNQPLIFDGIELICNGEIYNYKSLYKSMNITPNTGSDCEVIIHLYLKYGIKQTLTMLDGVFAFVLYDRNKKLVFVARDPYGVRPLYHIRIRKSNENICMLGNFVDGFASELKMLEPFYNLYEDEAYSYIGQFKPGTKDYSHAEQFEPGTYSVYEYNTRVRLIEPSYLFEPTIKNERYFVPAFPSSQMVEDISEYKNQLFSKISHELTLAVMKRCVTTERPVACLLSGGLDSSLIAALTADFFRGNNKQIETYSIGLENSEDIKYAKIVAEYIGSKHTEIIVTEKEMFDAIPEVIKAIESYDTTTVRASIGNYLIGKYIAANSDAKVIFNGDGSDELFGGYLYMNKCPDDIEFDKETRRLLKDIHTFDVLRSDKSISSNGLEPRTPFLDRNFVNAVLSVPCYFRNHNNFEEPEKYLLRHSFTQLYYTDGLGRQILPDDILWRRKEAFSDGVSSHGRSLFTILQEYIAERNSNDTKCEPSLSLEKQYYKEMFDKEYPNLGHILPYFWMPKYTDAVDPSARTLELYNKT